MHLSYLIFVLSYIGRPASSNTDLPKPKCDFLMTEKKDEIRINRSTPNTCQPFITYHLNNSMDILHIDVDIIASPHSAKNCDYASSFIVLPNGSHHCQKDFFCNIFHREGLTESQIPSWFVSLVKRKCNVTWIAVEQWPPRIEIKKRFNNFKADITYEFLVPKDRGRSLGGGGGGGGAQHNVDVEETKTSYVTPLAISIGAAAALAFVVGIAWHTHKHRRLRARRVSVISPYAVHVSIRRRSEIPFPPFNLQTCENHYDVPTPEDQPENEYLHPIMESPYCEIDNDLSGVVNSYDCDVYNMAESVGFREDSRSLQTFRSNFDLFSSTDNLHYSNEEMFTEHRASCSESIDDISDVPGPSVNYGEIVGTIGKDGLVERIEPCKDVYKSVRKNR